MRLSNELPVVDKEKEPKILGQEVTLLDPLSNDILEEKLIG